ncbi:hypothetical protein ABN763_18940, partial [Spongiivirga sp. MCCC 1A20706]|uniref:hypothetical protein n=1 Tax=Spongiivirga sp. MCCC 1A20706 TaxID=3160963 RepID=UPI0039775A40
MKILQNKLVRFVFLLLAIACTKEVTDDLLITFKVSAPAETLNCFVNIARPFEVTIRGINANTAGSYQFKYAVDGGSGYISYRGAIVEQDNLVMLSGATNELQFVGTEVGNASLIIT